MSTFVLVHGSWHGAWCWERFIPELAARGHEALAVDLPCEDGTATFHDYATTVVEAIGDATDVVLVGHSLGSVTIPLVAAQRTPRALVFLCGVIPKFGGLPWDDGPAMAVPGTFGATVTNDDGSTSWPSVATAAVAMYPDCSPEDAAWAFANLRKQNSRSLWEPYPLSEWPDTRMVSIAGRDDAAITPEFARYAARERLGIEAVEIEGGHSPFLARPAALAEVMLHHLRLA